MGYECFDVEVVDKVGHIRMTRPERHNSMIASFWRDLPEIVDEMSASGSVRCLVLSSEGRHRSTLPAQCQDTNGLQTAGTVGGVVQLGEGRKSASTGSVLAGDGSFGG